MANDHLISKGRSSKLLSMPCLLLIGVLSGCTTVNSGLQAGDLPPIGGFTAANGIQFNVQPLSLLTLPPKQTVSYGDDVYRLIQSSKRVDYSISPGDVLSINLIGYPDIVAAGTSSNDNNPYTSGYPVDQQGFIQFPLIGRIQASGLSVPQFTANLQSRLQRYLKYSDPQVKIVDYRGNKFFIDGEVNQPGEFAIADTPVSLYGAISLAGGATATGDSNNIILTRDGKSYSLGLESLRQAGTSGSQLYLRDGDSIHVNNQSLNNVYVLGELGQIEPVAIPEQGLSLSHVIGRSRGLDSATADATKVYIVRDNANNQPTNIYYVDMQTITNLALANRFEMQPNDIVYVDPTGLARWNRVISAILPSTSAINSISGF